MLQNKELETLLARHREEIAAGKLIVLANDTTSTTQKIENCIVRTLLKSSSKINIHLRIYSIVSSLLIVKDNFVTKKIP